MTCPVSNQIAQHCIEEAECTECGEPLIAKENIYGNWLECSSCNYSTDID